MTPLRTLPLLLLFAFGMAACEDPSNVGIGLVGDQGGTPNLTGVAPSYFEKEYSREITGNSARFLAGIVDDPLLGITEAIAYIDFEGVSGTSSAFRAGPVTAVNLLLHPSYVYGDTTSQVPIEIHDLDTDWTGTNVSSDTTIAGGALVTTFSFLPVDTLVTVPFPSDWIARNDTTLRSTSFAVYFKGLQLKPAGGNAVVGFTTSLARLQVVAGADTVEFPLSTVGTDGINILRKTLTTVRRLREPSLPEGMMLLQDSYTGGAGFKFALDAPELAGQAINRLALQVQADTAVVLTAPPNFVRPLQRSVTLYGIEPDSTRTRFGEFALKTDGTLEIASSGFTQSIQAMALGDALFDHFLLVPNVNQAGTLNALVFYGPTTGDRRPTGAFTLTPLD